jgi:hypothetical protein
MKINKSFKHSNPGLVLGFCGTVLLFVWISAIANHAGLLDLNKRLSLQQNGSSTSTQKKSVSL